LLPSKITHLFNFIKLVLGPPETCSSLESSFKKLPRKLMQDWS